MTQEATRRDVLTGLAAIAGLGIIPTQAMAQKPPANAPLVLPPMKVNLLNRSETPITNGTEYDVSWETTGSNGVKSLIKAHGRRTESGDTYNITASIGVSWWLNGESTSEPTQWQSLFMSVVDGVKGEIDQADPGYRNDTVTTTTTYGDGTTTKTVPTATRVLVNTAALNAMNLQEMNDFFVAKRLATMGGR